MVGTPAAFAGKLFASVKRWLRPSFLIIETQDTPGQQAAMVRAKRAHHTQSQGYK
jgi:hypothetical protein